MDRLQLMQGYRLVSRLFSYPDRALVNDVLSGALDAEFALVIAESSLSDAYRLRSAEDLFRNLCVTYTSLFIGTPHPRCSPFESVQRARLKGQRVDLFINEHATAVAEAYRKQGIMLKEGNSEPADHVQAETEFAAYLLACEITQGSSEGSSPFDCFFHDHLELWLYLLAQQIRDCTDEPLFLQTACVLDAVAPPGPAAWAAAETARLERESGIERARDRETLEHKINDSFTNAFGRSSEVLE